MRQIEIEQRSGDFRAHFKHDRALWEAGASISAVVGALAISHRESFVAQDGVEPLDFMKPASVLGRMILKNPDRYGIAIASLSLDS